MRALITGGTGFIGGYLLERIEHPVVLTRFPERSERQLGDRAEVHAWDPISEAAPAAAFEGVEAVFHLAGEPIPGIWTKSKRRRIERSRVVGTANLVKGIEALSERPKVLVSTSGMDYYGDSGDDELTEESPPGEGFLAEVVRQWEEEALKARDLGLRVVCSRNAIVLGRGGDFLKSVAPIFKLGLGGPLGGGGQWWSWIHVHDAVGIMLHAARTESLSGPVNNASPAPATNRVFTRALAKVLRRPALIPVPAFALKILLGEFSRSVLDSHRVIPARVRESGYTFEYASLVDALHEATGVPPKDLASAGGEGWRK